MPRTASRPRRNPHELRSQLAPGSRTHPGLDLTPAGPMTAAGPAPARDRWRFVPMAGWIRSYQRGWLRGDLIAGVTVAALIVPKNLGYGGRCGRDPLCGLRDEPADLDRAELGIGGGSRERRCGRRDHRTP
jgi:hypothetical protein